MMSSDLYLITKNTPISQTKPAPAQTIWVHADLIAERVRSAPGSPTHLEGPRGVDDPAEGPPERRFEGALFGGIGIGDGGGDHTEIARVAPVVLDDHPLCLAHDARAGLTEVLHRRVRRRHHVYRRDAPG